MTAKLIGYGAIGLMVLLQIYCQMVFKWRVNPSGVMDNASSPTDLVLKFILDPWILTAILAAFAGMLAWIVALSRVEISIAYPVAALVIPIVALLGMALFGESVSAIKLAGIALVCVGVMCVSLG